MDNGQIDRVPPCRDVESGNRMVTEWYASGNRMVCEAARKQQRGGVCAGYALVLSDTVVPSET